MRFMLALIGLPQRLARMLADSFTSTSLRERDRTVAPQPAALG